MQTINTSWRGIRPLLMHNGRLADPLDTYARALKSVSGKRKKTDADYEEMARLEHEGGLYFDARLGPVVTGDCITACILSGAKKTRIGKDVQAGVFVIEDAVPVEYAGPRTVKGMWAERDKFSLRKLVKVGTARVMRTRPMIPTGWRINFTIEYDPEIVDVGSLKRAIIDAGALCGLCDWRPRFGRFVAEFPETTK